jgi:hypothetical protein
VDIESRVAELERQKKIILEKYRPTGSDATQFKQQEAR